MTGEEIFEQFLKLLIVKLDQNDTEMDGLMLKRPEDYEKFKRDFSFTDEDVKRWSKGDLT